MNVIEALRQCADYLECIPESAAGGDDEAVRLSRMARSAIAWHGAMDLSSEAQNRWAEVGLRLMELERTPRVRSDDSGNAR